MWGIPLPLPQGDRQEAQDADPLPISTSLIIKSSSSRTKEIHVAVIEANEEYAVMLEDVISQPLDMRCVGVFREKTPDLHERLVQAAAEVILVELVLGTAQRLELLLAEERTSGIAAIRAIRRTLGET